MIRVAEWDGLRYDMEKESEHNHLIYVRDETGKKATFQCESGRCISTSLSTEDFLKAKKMMDGSTNDFLEYYNEMNKPL